MSNGYRAKWKDDSTREAEVAHFQRLRVAERFLNLVVHEATAWAEEKNAALDAGMDPLEVLCGTKMYEKMKADAAKEEAAATAAPVRQPVPQPDGLAAEAPKVAQSQSGTGCLTRAVPKPGESAPAPAGEAKGSASNASTAPGQAGSGQAEKPPLAELALSGSTGAFDPKPKRKQPYRARIHAPQMLALGTRAATLLLDLSPLILAQWKQLIACGTDPRRLALDDHDGKIAALLFDEIGVQYHDIDANEHERIAEALTKMEAWVRKLKEEGGPFDGGKGGAADAAPACPTLECGGLPPLCSPEPGESAGKPAHSKERQAAPYSAGGASLDWTKL